jgi:hypothetical protein
VPEVETEQAKRLAYIEEVAIDLVFHLFLLLNREDLKKSGKVKMPNFGLREDIYLEPYQIAFVAISILCEQGQVITGGIIGDDPGAGKMIQLIAQALTNFYHTINVKEVLEDRAKGNNRHHLADGHKDREKCPSATVQPIVCCCQDMATDHVYAYPPRPQTGCTVIFTPTPGVRSFTTDIVRMIEGADIMQLPVAPRFLVVTPDYWYADGIGLLDEAELLEVGIEASWDM